MPPPIGNLQYFIHYTALIIYFFLLKVYFLHLLCHLIAIYTYTRTSILHVSTYSKTVTVSSESKHIKNYFNELIESEVKVRFLSNICKRENDQGFPLKCYLFRNVNIF